MGSSKRSQQDRTLEIKRKYEEKNKATKKKIQKAVSKIKRMATLTKQGTGKKKSQTTTEDAGEPQLKKAKGKRGKQTKGPKPLVSDPPLVQHAKQHEQHH